MNLIRHYVPRKEYLGSAIGKQTFIESYAQQKVITGVKKLERF